MLCHRASSVAGQGYRAHRDSRGAEWLRATGDEVCLYLYDGVLYVTIAILDNCILKAQISSARVRWSK